MFKQSLNGVVFVLLSSVLSTNAGAQVKQPLKVETPIYENIVITSVNLADIKQELDAGLIKVGLHEPMIHIYDEKTDSWMYVEKAPFVVKSQKTK